MIALVPSHDDIDAFAEDRFDSLEKFAAEQISLWTSVHETAWRRERETLGIYCPKIRILTLGAFEIVKLLGVGTSEKGVRREAPSPRLIPMVPSRKSRKTASSGCTGGVARAGQGLQRRRLRWRRRDCWCG